MDNLNKIKENISINLKFLQKSVPYIYEKIVKEKIWEKPILVKPEGGDFSFLYYEEKVDFLYANSNERLKRFDEDLQILFYSPHHPKVEKIWKEFHDYIDNLSIENKKKVYFSALEELVILGLLPFFHLPKIINYILDNPRFFKNLKKIRIIEQNIEIFYAFLMTVSLEELILKAQKKGIQISIELPQSDLSLQKSLLRIMSKISAQSAIFGLYVSYLSQKQKELLDKAYEFLLMNYIILSPYHYKNAIENFPNNLSVPYLCKSKKIDIDKLVLLIGSGPSLEAELSLIKKHREKFYIISLTSTFTILAKNGIVPDAVVVLDLGVGIGKKIDIFSNHLDTLSKCIVLGTPEIDSKLFSLSKKGLMFSAGFFEHFIKNNDCEIYQKAPTVFVHALQLAIYLGFKNIAIVGVDLGTTKQEQFYAQGYGEDYEHRYLPYTYEGNFGEQVYTKTDYLLTKTTAEFILEIHKAKDINFFNSSSGLKIKGFTPMKLERVIEQYAKSKKEIDLDKLLLKHFEIKPGLPLDIKNVTIEEEMLNELIVLIKKSIRLFSLKKIEWKRFYKLLKKFIKIKSFYQFKMETTLLKANDTVLVMSFLFTLSKLIDNEKFFENYFNEQKEAFYQDFNDFFALLQEEKNMINRLKS